MTQSFVFGAVVIICVQISASGFQILNNGDCTAYRDRTTNESCNGSTGKFLVRSMACDEGSAVDICCRKPLRADAQASRNRWFRVAAFLGEQISVSCMKRIFCLQACLDTLYKEPRADYPEVLENDLPETKEYVDAAMRGTAIFYCSSNFRAPGRVVFRMITSMMNPHGPETCNRECDQIYPECTRDMETSALAYLLVRVSSIVHNLGMWIFGVATGARESLYELQALSE